MPTAAETFAGWALDLRLENVPADAQRAACRQLLDGIGCAIASARLDAVPFAIEAAARFSAPEEATVLGDGHRAPAPIAALANGALVHGLDFDDTHQTALVHATAAVLPAALAVGEETGATGAEVLAAAMGGYEIVIRLGAAFPHAFHARGFHATSVCGVFASAAVAARLYGLDAAAAADAFGIAGSQAAGSLEFLNTGSNTKQLHPGLSAAAGITAARLAAAGAEGPASILEGPYGLYRSYLGEQVDPASLTAELGERWEVTRITTKPYPACQLVHASLDALATVLERIPDAAAIDTMTFTVPEGSVPIVCEPAEAKRAPRTPYEGKFSLAYCAAAIVQDRAVTIGSFTPEQLARTTVLELAARVGAVTSDFAGPPADAPGMVEVVLRDGTTLHGEVAACRGGPEDPLSDDELLEKFVANVERDGARELADAVLALAEQPSLKPIVEAAT